jgi:hypothetical protein
VLKVASLFCPPALDTFGKITSKSGQRSLQASLRYSF